MANKKISQLTSMGTVGIGSADYLVTSESTGGGNYATVKTTPNQVSNYVLNPVTADQISGAEKNVFFNNSSWTTAGLGANFPYLQIDINNGGKLVTGSGISVPAIADNMGDCVATTDVYMQGNNITGGHGLYFGDSTSNAYDSRSFIDTQADFYGKELWVKAYTDLTLSGNDYVRISGQALSLENGDTQTPISGNVIITGGDLKIDPGNKLIVNEISGAQGSLTDYPSITVKGAIVTPPNEIVSFGSSPTLVKWSVSNVAWEGVNNDWTFNFSDVADGQSLTMYVENTDSSSHSATFVSGSAVVWGAEYGNTAPAIAADKTNLYTFVRINTGIFASAVTGYVY